MARPNSLPLPQKFTNVDEYIDSLLAFITSSELFQKLCGGVHILDFFMQEPDLYSNLLPCEWRTWFQCHDISDILDLLLREDLTRFRVLEASNGVLSMAQNVKEESLNSKATWRGGPVPPHSLLSYVQAVRSHTMDRTFEPVFNTPGPSAIPKVTKLSHIVASGMKPKKVHEVENFVKYIDDLTSEIALTTPYNITHIVDFGSGQNYLGRALASTPYNKSVIAVESKQLNIEGAMNMDVTAKLATKEQIMRNKKQYRREPAEENQVLKASDASTQSSPLDNNLYKFKPIPQPPPKDLKPGTKIGPIQYIEFLIKDGDLSTVIDQIEPPRAALGNTITTSSSPQLMVISLHSCGNLVHHGIRSLILNPSVKAVAMVGCCYNLVTERLGPPTFKLPSLRFSNLRIDRTSCVGDPHGFPMSERLATFDYEVGEGIRFNITSRMMAVQAPHNWTTAESDAFFTRHFYRALLQRVFFDRGVIDKSEPMILGSLRKSCYTSFIAYVRGAVLKLSTDKERGVHIVRCMAGLVDKDIELYEARYRERKKELSAVWSLMAFSAGVVESTIVVDRWLYLKEQDEVKDCWVEAVFEYKQSPRNLVVVGVKY